jgi:hypothetical protein
MTKKKGKPAAKQALKNKPAAKQALKKKTTAMRAPTTTRRPVARTVSSATVSSEATGGRTSQITIFLFRTSQGNKIRTAPQRAYAGPGFVEWTVVNMIDGSDVPVRITWPQGSPFAKESIEFRGRQRESADGVTPGVYKYVVHAFDTQEDPEVEFPEGN